MRNEVFERPINWMMNPDILPPPSYTVSSSLLKTSYCSQADQGRANSSERHLFEPSITQHQVSWVANRRFPEIALLAHMGMSSRLPGYICGRECPANSKQQRLRHQADVAHVLSIQDSETHQLQSPKSTPKCASTYGSGGFVLTVLSHFRLSEQLLATFKTPVLQ